MVKRIISVLIAIAITVPCITIGAEAKSKFDNKSKEALKAGMSFEDYVVSEILDFNTGIDIAAYTAKYNWEAEEVIEKIDAIIYSYPEIFALDNSDYECEWSEYNKDVFAIKTSYVMNEKEYKTAKKKLNAVVKEIKSLITDSMTDAQKVLTVHDYIIANSEYGNGSDMKYTAYGCLVDKEAICQGYAQAFSYVMKELGIECHIVRSEEMKHSWNYVKIGSKYYHVDLVYDDPSMMIDGKEKDYTGQVLHKYLLVSDKKISETHKNWKFYTKLKKATSTKYDNYYWASVRSQIIPVGNYFYYLSYNPEAPRENDLNVTNLIRRSIKTNKTKTVHKILCNWMIGDTNSFYLQTYARLSYFNGRLYYNTDKAVYSVSTSGKNLKKEFSPKLSGNSLYGSYVDSKGKLMMLYAKEQNTVEAYKKKTLSK